MSEHQEFGGLTHASGEDMRIYLDDLADLDIDEAHKLEFLDVLFGMMRTFVELGFDARACGQLLEAFNELSLDDSDELDSVAYGEKGDA